MTRPTLILSLAGCALEGVIEWPDGRRRRLEQPASLAAAVGWLLECDPRVATFGVAERAVWVARFKEVETRARSQAFVGGGHLRLLVPPGLTESQAEGLVVAAHLAGFPSVERIGLDSILLEGSAAEEGSFHLLVQNSGKQSRMWSLVSGAGGQCKADYYDLGDGCSLEVACRRLGNDSEWAPGDLEKLETVLARQLAEAADAVPARVALLGQDGSPRSKFIGRAICQEWSRAGVNRIEQMLKAAGLEPGLCVSINIHGVGAFALKHECRGRFEQICCNAFQDLSAPLETIGASPAGEPRLQQRLSVSAGLARRIAGTTFGQSIAAPAGMVLPAARVFESFPTAVLIDDFALEYGDDPARAVPVGKIKLPQLLETKPYCRLKLRVLADSPDHLVYSVTIADGLVDQTLIYNRRTSTIDVVSTSELETIAPSPSGLAGEDPDPAAE